METSLGRDVNTFMRESVAGGGVYGGKGAARATGAGACDTLLVLEWVCGWGGLDGLFGRVCSPVDDSFAGCVDQL